MMQSVNTSCQILFVLLALGAAAIKVDAGPGQPRVACLDEQGNAVDWYIGYKFPKLKGSKMPAQFKSGLSYAYISSKDVAQEQARIRQLAVEDSKLGAGLEQLLRRFKEVLGRFYKKAGNSTDEMPKSPSDERWKLAEFEASDQRSVLLRTVKAAYDKRVNVILYNDGPADEKPSETSEEPVKKKLMWYSLPRPAHAKGVLMMDEQTGDGVWLTHSMPKFPPRLDMEPDIPKSSKIYGQTFMCISFDVEKTGKQIIEHLVTMRPVVYDRRISTKLSAMFPRLNDLDEEEKLLGKEIKVDAKISQTITTRGGQELRLYSKSRFFQDDIYSSWIDAQLGSQLYVETWRRGKGTPLNSTCPAEEWHVNNVKDLKYDDIATWSYMNDHSKWAISNDYQHGHVCISDINRMESQFKRGGGMVCIHCPTCWSVFSNTIADVEPCPHRPKSERSYFGKSLYTSIRRLAKELRIV